MKTHMCARFARTTALLSVGALTINGRSIVMCAFDGAVTGKQVTDRVATRERSERVTERS